MAQQAQNLIIEADDCVTLTPDSPRYKDAIQQYRPQTIAEVRKLIGPSPASAGGTSSPSCCLPLELTASLPDPDMLTAKDEQVRFRARMLAATAASAYVRAADTRDFKQFEPALDRFIQLSKPILFSFLFADIDIASGATLTLAKNAHILFAANIRMHGTGRIVCKGPTTIRATTVNGRIRPSVIGSAELNAAQSSMRS
jgi:hypothetical protein